MYWSKLVTLLRSHSLPSLPPPQKTTYPPRGRWMRGGTSNPSKVVAFSQFWVIVRGTGVWPKSLGPGTLDIPLDIASAVHPSAVSGACLLVAARAQHQRAASTHRPRLRRGAREAGVGHEARARGPAAH